MDSSFRPLKTHERELLEKLLEPEFPGRDELRQQLNSVTAKQILEDGTLALQCDSHHPAPVKWRIPTEGECRDAEGAGLHVLLHVVDGFMTELEIYKDGQSELHELPSARDLSLFTPYGEAGVEPGGACGLVHKSEKEKQGDVVDSSFRPLKTHERELLEKLLEPEFPGRDELRLQLNSVTAKQIFEDGTLALQCGLTHPAPVKSRVPVEGECRDADGGPISVFLHVVDGFMNELEIVKYDHSKIVKQPSAHDLVVLV